MSGFAGKPTDQFHEWHDGDHTLRVRLYEFGEGAELALVPYVEAEERRSGQHPHRGPTRRWPLSEVVHLLQNVHEPEFWQIVAREVPDE